MEEGKIQEPSGLRDFRVNVRVRLAALWTSLMFLYIYADYFQLKAPGVLENTINLQTPVGPTTPQVLLGFSVLLIIPSLMIFLSVFLPPKTSRGLNIGVALFYAAISILIIISGIGDAWQAFFVLFNVIEVFLFALIIRQAWKWPRG